MEIFTQIAKDYGLFVALVVYVLWFFDRSLKESRQEHAEREARLLAANGQREARYIGVIDKLSDSFAELTKEVEAIKLMMEKEVRGHKIR